MTSIRWTVAIDGSIQRHLGDSELAFYALSKPDGIGDMFVHITLTAPSHSFASERVCLAWSILRASHPLLQCKVITSSDDNRPKYSFLPPSSIEAALLEANSALSFKTAVKEELVGNYLNGPRIILSDNHLSHLTISQTDPSKPEYQVFICAPHFTGDGTCLHLAIHDFLRMVSSTKSNDDLRAELSTILEKSHGNWTDILPPTLESMLPSLTAPWQRAISSVNFLKCRQREIGNHILPRVTNQPSSNTRILIHLFSEEDTSAILRLCKTKGISVNNAIFALCDISWARLMKQNGGSPEDLMPILLYSAINVRNSLPKALSTYWFLALTYFTISLPSFPPASPAAFWHRAAMSKKQTLQAVKSPFLLNRASLLATYRAKSVQADATAQLSKPQLPPHARVDPPAPSRALLGLSLLGNLDALYKQSDYPSVRLLSFTGASKLKKGGLLFLAHTFKNRLEFHLFWEENGFEAGVIERWWEGVKEGCYEFLLERK